MYKLPALLLMLTFSVGVSAQFTGPGKTSGLTTVESAKKAKDDTKVTLVGYIIKQIRPEHYMFKDSTGEIEVEIDTEDFKGIKVTPKIKVKIVGEIDIDGNSITIDIDHLELVKQSS